MTPSSGLPPASFSRPPNPQSRARVPRCARNTQHGTPFAERLVDERVRMSADQEIEAVIGCRGSVESLWMRDSAGWMRIGRSSNESATFDLDRDFAVENKALDVES